MNPRLQLRGAMGMSKIIGIDLGTTNSVVAVFEGAAPRIISNSFGQATTPSIVGFTAEGQRLVGPPARNQQVSNPTGTVYSVKRFMGRRLEEVKSEEKIVPYTIVGKPGEYVQVKVGRKKYTPQAIAAMVLADLKETAELYLGEPVEKAVITVPAYFNDAQRQATKDAGEIAGLHVERIINEPTAAALAYGLDRGEDKHIVIFDFGGGTFDLSLLKLGKGTFEVRAVHGNTHLGGDDFDQRLIDIVADDFRRKERYDIRDDAMGLQRLKEAAEQAKAELSHRPETTIMLPFISVDGNGPKHLQCEMARATFESVCTDLFDDLRKSCRQLLAEAGMRPSQIDDVVLVGGSTRIPKVQEIAREVFETDELNKSINPDEVVALGAAILGGVMAGDLENVSLMDVMSHAVGLETAHGGMTTIIPKNTAIPHSTKRTFSTPRDNQTSVPIHILEGDASKAAENRTLGLFQLTGIPKAPAGKPQIEVEFSVDVDGILNVSATDKWTGKTQQTTFKHGVGLDKTEIERMRREAMQNAEGAAARRETLDLRNHAEGVLHDMRKWMEFNATVMPGRPRAQIETALRKLEKKIRAEDIPGIRLALKKLDEISRPLRKAG